MTSIALLDKQIHFKKSTSSPITENTAHKFPSKVRSGSVSSVLIKAPAVYDVKME